MSDDIPEIEVNAPVRIGLHLTPAELRVLSTIRTFITSDTVLYGEHLEELEISIGSDVLDAILQGAGFVKTDSGDV